MRTLAKILRDITSNPWVNIVTGLIFFTTGIYEIVVAIQNETTGHSVGVPHGAALFGLLHALKYFPDLVEGSEYVSKSLEP